MTLYVKVGGSWQTVNDPRIKVGGTWQQAQNVYAKVGGTWQTIYTRFTPVTHTYIPSSYPTGFPPGEQEVVPQNATHLRITCQGGGGGGGVSTGGGGGGYSVKDIAIDSSDWPSGSARYLQMDGNFPVGGEAAALQDGTHAQVTGTLAVGAINVLGNGGAFAGAGGTASGGDTNTSGGAGGGSGGVAGGGGSAGNGGGLNSDGLEGYIRFEWT